MPVFTINALEPTPAKLCKSITKTDDDIISGLTIAAYLKMGFVTVVEREDEEGEITSQTFLPKTE